MANDQEPEFTIPGVAKVAASNVIPGLWTMLRGDPNAQTTLGRYVPGGVQGLVGGVGQYGIDFANVVGNKVLPAVGLPPTGEIPTPDFITTAQQHHDAAAAQADKDIGTVVQPQNAAERVARDVTRSVTELGFLPGVGGLTRLAPTAIRAGLEVAAPALLHPYGVGIPAAAIAGTAATYREATSPDQGPAFQVPGTDAVSAPTTPTTPGGPAFRVPGAVATDTSASATAPEQPAFQIPGGTELPNVPTPTAHDTSFTLGDAGTLALGALTALALHRPITSAWRAVTDTKRTAEWAQQREAVGLATADPAFPKPPGYDPATAEPVPQVQLPGDTGIGTALATKFINKDTRVQNTLEAYSETPQDALSVKRAYGMINDRLTAANKSREFIETGIDGTVQVQLPAVGRYARRYAALDPDMQTKINATAQRMDELNDRDELMRRALAKGQTLSPDDTSLRQTLWEEPTSQMRQTVNTNMSDPVVKQFIDEYNAIKETYLQHAVDRGLISQDTADNLLSKHPNHISRVDPTGRLVDLFGQREIGERLGPNVRDQDFVQTMQAQLPEMIRSADINDSHRIVVETFLNGQARDPRLPTVVTEIPERAPDGGPITSKERNLLHVGYGTGLRSFEFHDPVLFKMVTDHNDFMPIGLQGAAHANQMMQSFTTGVGSLLTGRLFGLATNLPRNILAGSTQRPKGMAGGITDKLVQSATGGRVGLRVADPLSVLGAGYELAAGSGALFVKGIANVLERNAAPGAKLLRAMLGPQGTRNLIDGLNRAYARSNLSQARQEGAAGAGQGSRSRVGGLTYLTPRGPSLKLSAESAERPYNPSFTNVPELYHGRGMSFGIRARALVNDINNLMNDAYHLHVRRLNPQMPSIERAYEVNQLVGAPGRTGESKGARAWATLVPYLNPSIQGTARAVQAYREAPLGTAFGKLLTYSLALGAEQWFAQQGGATHLNYLTNVLTPRQQAGNVFLMTDANDPANHARLPVPQEDWWLLPLLRIGLQHVTTAWQSAVDGDYRKAMSEAWGNLFNHYLTAGEAETALYSVAQLADPFIQAPTAVNMFLNTLGQRYRGDITSMVQAARAGQPLFGQKGVVTQGVNEPYRLPGQDLSHEGGDNGIFNAMLSSWFGATYTTVAAIGKELQHAHSVGEFVSGMGDVMQQRFRQLNAIGGGILFPAATSVSPRGSPEQQYVRNTMTNLKDVQGLLQNQGLTGMTRPGGEQIAVRGEVQMSDDPIMKQLAVQANALHNYLETNFQKKINDLDKLRQSLANQRGTQDAKREAMNDYARDEQAIYIQAQQVIDKANEQASFLVNAPVNFGMKINWGANSMQFHEGSTAQPQFQIPTIH